MDINKKINEFLNTQTNSTTLIEFISKYFDIGSFPEKIRLKFILEGQIKVNNSVIKKSDYKLKPNSKVSYGRLTKIYKKGVREGIHPFSIPFRDLILITFIVFQLPF